MNKAASITVRPSTMDDLARIVDIGSRTWDGDDYIPHVAERWITSTHGVFAVAELDGVLCGFGRLAFHSPQHGWLEGLRVDAAYQRRGVARAIGRYLMDTAFRAGVSTLRFATAVDNKESIALNESAGFVRIGGGRWLDCDLTADELAQRAETLAAELGATPELVTRLRGDELGADSPFIRQVLSSHTIASTGGMIPSGFVFYPAEPDYASGLAVDGYAYSAPRGQGDDGAILLATIWAESPTDRPEAVINVLEGGRRACAAALAAALRDFRRDGIADVVATVPCESVQLEVLKGIGYTSWLEDDCPVDNPTVILFDYPINTQQQLEP